MVDTSSRERLAEVGDKARSRAAEMRASGNEDEQFKAYWLDEVAVACERMVRLCDRLHTTKDGEAVVPLTDEVFHPSVDGPLMVWRDGLAFPKGRDSGATLSVSECYSSTRAMALYDLIDEAMPPISSPES